MEESSDLGGYNSENEDKETSWSDWNDESVGIICLFCEYNNEEFTCILGHMKDAHNFDFEATVKDLTFYQKVGCVTCLFLFISKDIFASIIQLNIIIVTQVKVVNYIKRQVQLRRCIFCEAETDNVLEHMANQQHCKLPEKELWDQPESVS